MKAFIKWSAVALATGALTFGCATDRSAEEPVNEPGVGGAGEAGLPPTADDYTPEPTGQEEAQPPIGDDEAIRTSPTTPPQDTGGDPLPPEAKVGDEGQMVDDRSTTADNPLIPSDPNRLDPAVEEAVPGEADTDELGDGDAVFPSDHSARDEQAP